jgi:hypothetical protein
VKLMFLYSTVSTLKPLSDKQHNGDGNAGG